MAARGDAVECPCGEVLKLENDRVPWHKTPKSGHRHNCQRSGVLATNWDAVHAVGSGAVRLVLACPACGEKSNLRNGKGPHELVCGACGCAGTLTEFAADALAKHKVEAEPARVRRYGR